jgi:hypothetical protein
MDDRTDRALHRIERDIERERAAAPCDDYERTSRHLPQCTNCGWIHE